MVLQGGDESQFRLPSLQMEDSGNYDVKVTAGGRTVVSKPVVVLVIGGLKVSPSPTGSVRRSTDVTFTLSLISGGTPTQINWLHGGQMIQGATKSVLPVLNAQFTDAGTYAVRAFHPILGRVVSSPEVRLRVYAELEQAGIVVQPRNQVAASGNLAVFSVGASGTLPFRYQWQKGANNIPGATNFFLRIANITAADAGEYHCLVVGAVGPPVATTSATLRIQAPFAANSVADSLVISGRAALTLHTNPGVAAASATFSSAVRLQPDHELANLFYAFARVADLVNQKSVNDFLDRLGVSKTNRDLNHWTAIIPRDTNHSLTMPPGVDASELPSFARTNLLVELKAALGNLDQVRAPGFNVDLSKAETALGDVTIDQGDLHLVRAAFGLAEYFIRTLNAWNASAQLTDLSGLNQSGSFSVETLLRNYPNLLTVADATQVAPARQALESVVDAYVQGAGIIRSRPAGLTRLFNVDRQDYESEERWRQFLLDLKASLSEVVTFNERPDFQATLRQLVDETVVPRSLLPSFKVNSPDPATVPNPSYAGSIRSQGTPVILLQPVARSRFEVGVFAVGQEPLKFQWQKGGVNLPNATNSVLTFASAGIAGTNQLRVLVSNKLGSVASKTLEVVTTGGILVWSARLNLDSLANLSLSGPSGVQVIIETSRDLRKWTPAATNEMPSDGILTFLPFSPGTPLQFFRAVAQ